MGVIPGHYRYKHRKPVETGKVGDELPLCAALNSQTKNDERNVITFRVDRMANVRLTGDPAVPAPSGFDAAAYAAQSINMYGGEECEIQLLCRNELMRVVVDRFGEDVLTETADVEHFTATVRMCASPTFYAWVFQFGGGISILSPSQVVNEYIAVCQESICAQNPNG